MRGFFDAHNSTYTPPRRVLVIFMVRRLYSRKTLWVSLKYKAVQSRLTTCSGKYQTKKWNPEPNLKKRGEF